MICLSIWFSLHLFYLGFTELFESINVSFTKFENLKSIISSNIFFCHILSSPSGTSITHMLDPLLYSYKSWSFGFILFSLLLRLDDFIDLSLSSLILSAMYSFCFQPIYWFIFHISCVFILEWKTWFYFIASVSLLIFPIFLFITSMFSLTSLSRVITAGIKSLSTNSNTEVILGLVSVDCLFYRELLIFSWFFICKVIWHYILDILNIMCGGSKFCYFLMRNVYFLFLGCLFVSLDRQ